MIVPKFVAQLDRRVHAELARSLFNLLRARTPNPATDEGKATVADMLHCVKTVLKCSSAAEGFAEARYNILQLPLALPMAAILARSTSTTA